MLDLLRKYMPHEHCWSGDTDWIIATVISHGGTAVAYAVLALLVAAAARRAHGVARWLGILCATFIGSCGLTHALAIGDMYNGLYRLSTVTLVITASVSLLTAGLASALAIQLRGRVAALRFWSDTINASLRTVPEMIGDMQASRSLMAIAQTFAAGRDDCVLVGSIQSSGYNTGRIFAVSTAFAEMLGYAPAQLVGQNMFSHIVNVEESTALADREALASGEDAARGVVNQWRNAAGEPVTLRWMPLHHIEGDPIGAWIAVPA